ncbi:DUF1302 domain-containing protein [Pseudomonas jilinensis]|uniref:DUF1302 domain-containing protein n=1 Tax=Pseudomonas jilinensis TaxID=2078689 RepID=A0A396S5Z3_9PSED|nr:DUF1302 domain-containing protein [Pseudomonas jilinensis]RHW22103.1 DUF1302 domain-containing protein [Pseudomonas jilinensis]
MTKKMHAWSLAALPLAIGLASFSGSANAANFNIGPIDAQFDSTLSVGASMSTQNADKRFIGVANGGQAAARTSDDGRQNYKSGDWFSKIFRGVHDLEMKYENSGAFFRGKYWYDFETKDGSQRFYDISDRGRPPLVKGSGVALLDAFFYHNYFIGNNPGNIRIGRQVVSWGESTFIGNSINSINPIDVAAFRRPGAEIKEGLMPVEMLYLSQGLTDSLSLEAFYQLKWHASAIDNCGTFFGADTLATGCLDRLVVAGQDFPQGQQPPGTYIVRAKKDRDASDSGQFGVALRWFVPALNDTEFGFFAMNYHSRAPYYSNIAGLPPGVGNPILGLDGVNGPAGYFFEYPEDIRLYGVSFQTNVGGTALSGELSYRPNMPLQLNTGDMSRTALVNPATGQDNTHRGLQVGIGDEISGYERQEVYQAQITAIHFIERVMGASRLSLVGEVGVNYIAGIGDLKFGRDSLFGQSPFVEGDGGAGVLPAGQCSSFQGTPVGGSPKAASWCENDGFMTRWSSGYRLRAALDYSNVFAGINLSPSISWSHDIDGYGPNFSENAKAVSLGLNADYANKYNASISYTNFFDGKYNTNVDRDFLALSFGVSF